MSNDGRYVMSTALSMATPPATEVAEALGYTSHGGVVTAVRRAEKAARTLSRRVDRLATELANS